MRLVSAAVFFVCLAIIGLLGLRAEGSTSSGTGSPRTASAAALPPPGTSAREPIRESQPVVPTSRDLSTDGTEPGSSASTKPDRGENSTSTTSPPDQPRTTAPATSPASSDGGEQGQGTAEAPSTTGAATPTTTISTSDTTGVPPSTTSTSRPTTSTPRTTTASTAVTTTTEAVVLPSAPRSLVVENLGWSGGGYTLKLSWSVPSNPGTEVPTSYLGTWPGGSRTASTSGRTVQIESLPPDTEIQLSVAAVTGEGRGATATTSYRTGFAPSSAPSAPVGLTIQDLGWVSSSRATGYKAVISWSPPRQTNGATITGYQILIEPGGYSFTVSPNATSTALHPLAPETVSTITVWAVSDHGPGERATPVTYVGGPDLGTRPIDSPATPPTGLTYSIGSPSADGSTTAVTVSWGPPTDDGGSPIIDYSVAWPGGSTVQAGTSITLNLPSGASSAVSVRAGNVNGAGPAATISIPVP